MSDSKARVIEHIIEINPSAPATWLASFDVPELRAYLDHLLHACSPRGNAWVRQGGKPAATRRPAA